MNRYSTSAARLRYFLCLLPDTFSLADAYHFVETILGLWPDDLQEIPSRNGVGVDARWKHHVRTCLSAKVKKGQLVRVDREEYEFA